MSLKEIVLSAALCAGLGCAHSGTDYKVNKEDISCKRYSEDNVDMDICKAYPKEPVIFIYSKRVSVLSTICDATVISYDRSLSLAEMGIVNNILVPLRENLGNGASCSAKAYLDKLDYSPETNISKSVKWTTLEDKGCDGTVDSVAQGTSILPDACYSRSDKEMSEGYYPDRLFEDIKELLSR